jgi:ribonuclease VapC
LIIDTSALVAILKQEDDAQRYQRALVRWPARMSVAAWLEATIVMRQMSEDHVDALDELIADFKIELVPVSTEQAASARRAHRRYGRGSGSPARLNFGDCFSYALAAAENDTLLFKGEDFAHTDIVSAI